MQFDFAPAEKVRFPCMMSKRHVSFGLGAVISRDIN